jgi:UDP-N-acetylglucosamine/UDP-N-acetylgalactosamine 4-epimerase
LQKLISNSRVLITGGAGFIGSNLCEALIQQNNDVVCLDNFATGHIKNIKPLIKHDRFHLIEGDIRNIEDCKKATERCDFVLHHAAMGSVPRSIEDPMTTTDVNIGGFVKVLYAAVEAGVKRFVYAASSSTYGDHEGLPKVEDKIGNPLSPYAITKLADELFAENFSKIYGIEIVGLRYFNVFGRRQDPNGAYAAVIPKFVLSLMNHVSPVINGTGDFSRDFTYIENVIQANQLAAKTSTKLLYKDAVKHEVFNVAFGERTNLNELFEMLKTNLSQFDKEVEMVDVVHGPYRTGDIPHSLASIEKAKELLGYSPQYSVKDGLKAATQWYWENLGQVKKNS